MNNEVRREEKEGREDVSGCGKGKGRERYVLLAYREDDARSRGAPYYREGLSAEELGIVLEEYLREGYLDEDKKWDLRVVHEGRIHHVWDWTLPRTFHDPENYRPSALECIMSTACRKAKKRTDTELQRRKEKERQQWQAEELDRQRRGRIMFAELQMKMSDPENYFFVERLYRYAEWIGTDRDYPRGSALDSTGHEVIPSESSWHGEALVKAVEELAESENRSWDEVFEDICKVKEGVEDGKWE